MMFLRWVDSDNIDKLLRRSILLATVALPLLVLIFLLLVSILLISNDSIAKLNTSDGID